MKTRMLFAPLTALAALALLVGCAGQTGSDEVTAAGEEAVEQMEEASAAGEEAVKSASGAPAAPAAEGRPARPASGATGSPASGGRTIEPGAAAPTAGAPAPTTTGGRMLTLPAGKRFKLDMDSMLSTATSKVGDTFTGTVSKTVHLEEGTVVAVKKGAKVEGTVTEVESTKRVKGLAKLALRFDTLILADGTRVPITASLLSEAEDTKKRDAATIAGGAVGGAILGKVIGKDDSDALKGALAGAAIGTGVVLGTKGKEVEIQPGAPLVLELQEPVMVPAPAVGA
jgi:hypothetical protein